MSFSKWGNKPKKRSPVGSENSSPNSGEACYQACHSQDDRPGDNQFQMDKKTLKLNTFKTEIVTAFPGSLKGLLDACTHLSCIYTFTLTVLTLPDLFQRCSWSHTSAWSTICFLLLCETISISFHKLPLKKLNTLLLCLLASFSHSTILLW